MTNQSQDQSHSFVSGILKTHQSYRLFIPSCYDRITPLPLIVALHGTSGNQDTYFDNASFGEGIYKIEGEMKGFAVLCPFGRDELNRPTEWRGTGEIHVMEAIESVCNKISIDRNRIILTGLSMGGTGTTYLCCRYPDIFACGIPLGSTYGHVSLVPNLKNTPMYFMQGENDWPVYAKTGPVPISNEMNKFDCPNDLWFIPNEEHNIVARSAERVFEIASSQKRVSSPRSISHRAYFPAHGKAWWIDISKISVPGKYGEVKASTGGNRIDIYLRNIDELVVRPDNDLIDRNMPISIYIEKIKVFKNTLSNISQIRIKKSGDHYEAEEEPLYIPSVSERLSEPLFFLEEVPTWAGEENSYLGNLMSDSMLETTNADIALVNRGHYMFENNFRGALPMRGIVTTGEFINWLRPLDTALAVTYLKGIDIIKLLELNLTKGESRFIIQGAGFTYDYSEADLRITKTDIVKDKIYRTVFRLADITRTDTMVLGDLYDKIEYTITEENILSALWYKAHNNYGILRFSKDKRVLKAD